MLELKCHLKTVIFDTFLQKQQKLRKQIIYVTARWYKNA